MNRVSSRVATVLAALGIAAATGCSDSTGGLSDQEVREVVRDEIAAASADDTMDAVVSHEEMNQAIAEAVASIRAEIAAETSDRSGDSQTEASSSQVEPSKSDPAEYTKFVVSQAIDLYEAEGLDAVIDYHNRVENVDDQWYVFVVGEDGQVISHFEPDRRGARLDSWVGVDPNGYQFGLKMLAAASDGNWVTYVYRNPATADINAGEFGDLQLKNAWAVRHDGLLFVSGWYVDADALIPSIVSQSADLYLASPDLDAYLERLTSTDSLTAATSATVEYYNSSGSDGQWIGFIADSSGEVITAPSTPELEGLDIVQLLGSSVRSVEADGSWLTEADNDPGTGPLEMRIWVMYRDDHYFGAGWYEDVPN